MGRAGCQKSFGCTVGCKNPQQCPHVVRRYEVIRLISFDLINHPDTAYPPHGGDDVPPKVTAARGKDHFIKSRSLICAGYHLFPFLRNHLKRDVGISFQQFDNVKPWERDGFNQPAFTCFWTRDDNRLQKYIRNI